MTSPVPPPMHTPSLPLPSMRMNWPPTWSFCCGEPVPTPTRPSPANQLIRQLWSGLRIERSFVVVARSTSDPLVKRKMFFGAGGVLQHDVVAEHVDVAAHGQRLVGRRRRYAQIACDIGGVRLQRDLAARIPPLRPVSSNSVGVARAVA